MSSKILDPREEKKLQPATGLWKLYTPDKAPHRFQANTLPEANAWQTSTRAALGVTLGFQDLSVVDLAPEIIEMVDRGDFIREKVLLHVSEDALMPVYILKPKTGLPFYPVVIAFAGHGYGAKEIVGLWEDGSERENPDGIYKDFAVALVRKGFLVAAPEISCFGERQTDFAYLDPQLGSPIPISTCTHTAMLAFHLGGSVIGLRVQEGKRLVDYLATRPDADLSHLGSMCLSGGGLHTFYSACMDERIQVVVISGYFSTFEKSILAMHHCACNFVPGIGRFGEEYDLIGLIAPRPVLIEAANRDPIFPIEAVVESVARARQVYNVFGAADRLETDYFEGRHQIGGRRAYHFLWEHSLHQI